MEVTKWLKPSISVSRIGDSASVQAATQVNAEQTSKRTSCGPTWPSPASGWSMPRPRKGLPVLHRSSSCMHAVAITPVESQSASFALFLCNISLPRNHGGSASTSRLSRPAQRSLALRPAYSPSHFHDPLHRRLQPFRYLHNCSDCYRLERPKLPGGICTRWKTLPLHGAHDK